ncbi:hypothetical protein C8034_v006069 [Colletotrichum sidae]|uniref:Uncharacterized protein n=1 Tax=Colletotrichum sidae TaxID=1347389 RepID=A0A4R8TTJ2_9PEZI|nr:hypothetical protein C8034_v006069 [Colletotrichum sidae]
MEAEAGKSASSVRVLSMEHDKRRDSENPWAASTSAIIRPRRDPRRTQSVVRMTLLGRPAGGSSTISGTIPVALSAEEAALMRLAWHVAREPGQHENGRHEDSRGRETSRKAPCRPSSAKPDRLPLYRPLNPTSIKRGECHPKSTDKSVTSFWKASTARSHWRPDRQFSMRPELGEP